MKRGLFLLIFINTMVVNHAFSQEERWPVKRGTLDYIVEKIDSVYDYYLVYVSRNNGINTYRLVEKKKIDRLCSSSIIVGNVYSLPIHGMVDNMGVAGYIGGLDFSVEIEKGVFIPNEPEWGYDIYYADEIEGLCYKK
jgi:hypothetical protein